MNDLLPVRSGRNGSLFALAPFTVLLLASLGMLGVRRWATGDSWDWSLRPDRWLGGNDCASALSALSNSAEVVAE
jgi:hypothetical protein